MKYNWNPRIFRLSYGPLKFIFSEKAKKIWEIFHLLLTTVDTVKSKVKISQNFVAFSEYMNFTSPHALAKANIFWAKKALNVQLLYVYQVIHQISYFVAKGQLRPRGQKRPLKGQKKPKSSRSNYNSIRILDIFYQKFLKW